MSWEIRQGDALIRLREMPAESVQCCITSPPYFGLRDYGHDGQIGLEPTPDEYVARLVEVFREVRRVLRDDGTLWLNLGDSYAHSSPQSGRSAASTLMSDKWNGGGRRDPMATAGAPARGMGSAKPKDLIGIPWLLAFALRADGWFLRSEVIWAKPNPMPESVRDRPTRAHEQVFLLSKSARYFYDAEAVREGNTEGTLARFGSNPARSGAPKLGEAPHGGRLGEEHNTGLVDAGVEPLNGRNRRSVWTVATQPYAEAHFATFPPKLIESMVLAGSSPQACGKCGAPWEREVERQAAEVLSSASEYGDGAGRNDGGRSMLVGAEAKTLGWQPTCTHSDDTGSSVVLDPFAGAGTTGVVSLRHGRSFVGIELSPDYCELARRRIRDDAPLMNTVSEAAA